MNSNSQTHYEVLGLNENASTQEIRQAYRRLARECHPDRPAGNSEKFARVNEAYTILSDASKRASYDSHLRFLRQFGGSGSENYRGQSSGMHRSGSSNSYAGWPFEDLSYSYPYSGSSYGSRGAMGMDEDLIRLLFEQMARSQGRSTSSAYSYGGPAGSGYVFSSLDDLFRLFFSGMDSPSNMNDADGSKDSSNSNTPNSTTSTHTDADSSRHTSRNNRNSKENNGDGNLHTDRFQSAYASAQGKNQANSTANGSEGSFNMGQLLKRMQTFRSISAFFGLASVLTSLVAGKLLITLLVLLFSLGLIIYRNPRFESLLHLQKLPAACLFLQTGCLLLGALFGLITRPIRTTIWLFVAGGFILSNYYYSRTYREYKQRLEQKQAQSWIWSFLR